MSGVGRGWPTPCAATRRNAKAHHDSQCDDENRAALESRSGLNLLTSDHSHLLGCMPKRITHGLQVTHKLGESAADSTITQLSRPNQPTKTKAAPAAKPRSPNIITGFTSVAVRTIEITLQIDPRITRYERSESISGASWFFMRPNAVLQPRPHSGRRTASTCYVRDRPCHRTGDWLG